MRRASVLVMMVGGLLLAGCGADDVPVTTGGSGGTGSTTVTTVPDEAIPDGADGLAEARRRWEASGIDDYVMTYQERCFCPQTVVTVTVRAGAIADVSVDEEPVAGRPPEGRTVEDLFDELQRAVDEDAFEIRASYDTATGRPLRFWIDLSEMMADEEHGVEVTDFTTEVDGPDEPTGTSPSVVTTGTTQMPSIRSVAAAELTEMWGCGFLFSATNAEHTVAVQLRPTTRPAVGASTVTLPDPGWEGDVQLGTDLLTVPCIDRDVRSEPVADETWPVVGGTLEITAPASQGCGGATPATATVHDLAVVAPDGSTITFADLTFTNDQWGCSAG